MYKGSKTEEKINSLETFSKLSDDIKFVIREYHKEKTFEKNRVIVRRVPDAFNRDFVLIIYDDDVARFHFELDKFVDNELIVELNNYKDILLAQNNDIKIIAKEDDDSFYFQIPILNQHQLDMFFELIVWPHIIQNESDFL